MKLTMPLIIKMLHDVAPDVPLDQRVAIADVYSTASQIPDPAQRARYVFKYLKTLTELHQIEMLATLTPFLMGVMDIDDTRGTIRFIRINYFSINTGSEHPYNTVLDEKISHLDLGESIPMDDEDNDFFPTQKDERDENSK